MTTIVTRAGKGSPLTHTEVDTNFTNLNTAKLETAAIPLGTLAAPSISFTGDANTGVYSPGADTLAFVTAGANRLHITSGGLVGIGTTSNRDSTKLDVLGDITFGSNASYYGTLGYNAGTGHVEYTSSDGAFKWIRRSGSATSMVLDSSGRLLVGTTSGSGDALLGIQGRQSDSGRGGILQLRRGQAASALSAGDDIGAIRFSDNTSGNTGFAEILCASDAASGASDYPGRLVFSTTADGAATPTERMRIDSTGLMTLAGPGIKFPATQVASADANVLDDYEEGTWTPNQGSGLVVVGTFSSTGRYTKVGNLVYVTGNVQGSTSIAITAGSILCSNLIFTQALDGCGGNCTNYQVNQTAGLYATGSSTNLYATSALTASLAIFFGFTFRV